MYLCIYASISLEEILLKPENRLDFLTFLLPGLKNPIKAMPLGRTVTTEVSTES